MHVESIINTEGEDMVYYSVGTADRLSNVMIKWKPTCEMQWALVTSVAPVLHSFDIIISAKCLCLLEIAPLNREHRGCLIGFLFCKRQTPGTWHLAVCESVGTSQGVSKPAAEEAEAPRRPCLPSSWSPSLLPIYLGWHSFALRCRTAGSTGDLLYSALSSPA